jgi:2-dehydropantoate 2-reductase
MRICIVGSGAIGGFIGVKLAVSGQDVTLIDQGQQLSAIKKNGIRLIMADGTEHHEKVIPVTDNYEKVGPQDMVFLGLKAQQIHQVVEKLPALFGPDTSVITIQNGLPWWYFQRHGGEYDGRRLESLDPSGVIDANIEADRIIGCVAYPAATVPKPGIIHHVEGDRFPVGELDGSESRRCLDLVDIFSKAGLRSRVITDIRAEIWLKAWGALSFNPISALTHATLVDICQFPDTRNLAADMMKEAQEIAGKLGIQFRRTIERRLEGTEAVGAHKTSMLQDVEAGRDLETEALMGSVIEIAKMTNTPAPAIEAIYACVKLLEKTYTKANAKVNLL